MSAMSSPVSDRRRLGRHGLGFVVAALVGCQEPPVVRTLQYPFMVNRSTGPVQLRLTRLPESACEGDLAIFASALTRADLRRSEEFTLASGEVAAVDQPAVAGQSSARQCHLGATITVDYCAALLVEMKDGPAAVMRSGHYLEIGPEASRCRMPRMDPDTDPGTGALALVRLGGRLAFEPHAGIETVAVSRADIEARGAPPDAGAPDVETD